MRPEIELKGKFRKNLENGPLELKLRVGKVQLPSECSSHELATSEAAPQNGEKIKAEVTSTDTNSVPNLPLTRCVPLAEFIR